VVDRAALQFEIGGAFEVLTVGDVFVPLATIL
jgi:hypothetical protein